MDNSPPPPVIVPQYVAPPPDPALAQLQQQSIAQGEQATQVQAQHDTSRLAQMYGIRSAVGGQPIGLAAPAPPAATGPAVNTGMLSGLLSGGMMLV